MEPCEASISDHRDGQSGARPAVEDLSHRRLQAELINPAGRVRRVLPCVGSNGERAHRLCSFLTSPNGCTSGYLGSIGVMMPTRSSMAAAASRHMSSRYRGPITCTA